MPVIRKKERKKERKKKRNLCNSNDFFRNLVRMTKSRRLRWADHVARMEELRSAFKILTGKPTGKIPSGRSRCRWEDNIIMYLKESIRANGFIRLRIGTI